MKQKLIALAIAATLSTSVYSDTPEKVSITIGTGTEGGFYWNLGNQIANEAFTKYKRDQKKAPISFTAEESMGTIQNIADLCSGERDLVIVQADGLDGVKCLPADTQVVNAHKELIYFIINKEAHEKHGIDDLEDLEGHPEWHLAVIADSGALVTLRKFVKEDSGYKPNLDSSIEFESFYDAIEAVASGTYRVAGEVKDIVAMLYVTRPGTLSERDIEDFKKKLVLGEATDKDFNDAEDFNGEDLYTNCDLDSDLHQGIEGATMGAQETICVRAQIAYSLKGVQARTEEIHGEKAPKYFKKIRAAVKKGINGTVKHFQ